MGGQVDIERFRGLLIEALGYDPDVDVGNEYAGGGKKYGPQHLAEVMVRQNGARGSSSDKIRFFLGHRPVSERVIRARAKKS